MNSYHLYFQLLKKNGNHCGVGTCRVLSTFVAFYMKSIPWGKLKIPQLATMTLLVKVNFVRFDINLRCQDSSFHQIFCLKALKFCIDIYWVLSMCSCADNSCFNKAHFI